MQALKITVLLIIFSCSFFKIKGQSITREVIASAGKETHSSAVVLQSNVGEAIISTLQISSNILTEGFAQPENILLTSSSSNDDFKDYSISIFPNPATDKVTFTSNNNKAFQIRISDLKGQLIKLDVIQSNKTIDISQVPSGVYFISVIDPNTKLTVANYKLVKL